MSACPVFTNEGGLGVIIRNPVGEVMAAYSRECSGPFPPEVMVVLLAMVMGLRLALDQGLDAIVLESDAHEVVECVAPDDESYLVSESDGHILNEVRSLLGSFSFGVCRYQYSKAAFILAYQRPEERDFVGMKEMPEWFIDYIADDARSSY